MSTTKRRSVEKVVHFFTRDAKPLIVAVTGPRQTGKTTIIRDALWLAAGLFIDAKEHRPEVVAFVLTGREPRVRHMLDFLVPGWPRRRDLPEPWDDWEAPNIAALFKAFARWHDPWWGGQGDRSEATTLSLRTDWLLRRWIEILRERREREAREALDALARSPALDSWYEELTCTE